MNKWGHTEGFLSNPDLGSSLPEAVHGTAPAPSVPSAHCLMWEEMHTQFSEPALASKVDVLFNGMLGRSRENVQVLWGTYMDDSLNGPPVPGSFRALVVGAPTAPVFSSKSEETQALVIFPSVARPPCGRAKCLVALGGSPRLFIWAENPSKSCNPEV